MTNATIETIVAERDNLWNRYQAMLADPKAYRSEKMALEVMIEDLNEVIAAEIAERA